MQLPVHHLRRRYIHPEALGPGRAIGAVAITPAFRARAMSGSEGDRFVVEIQERVVMWLPLLMPAPSELERAGDPEVACVEADDLMAAVKDAPVARPRAPERDRFDVTSWRYTITGRRHVPVTLINRQGSAHPAPIDPYPRRRSWSAWPGCRSRREPLEGHDPVALSVCRPELALVGPPASHACRPTPRPKRHRLLG